MKLSYLKPYSTPLGQVSDLVASNTKEWEIQSPVGEILSVDNNELLLLFDPTDVNYPGFVQFMHTVDTGNKQWRERYFPKSKQKQLSVGMKFECKLHQNTDIFDCSGCMSDHTKLSPKKRVIVMLRTPSVWISKRNYGNTWSAYQIMIQD